MTRQGMGAIFRTSSKPQSKRERERETCTHTQTHRACFVSAFDTHRSGVLLREKVIPHVLGVRIDWSRGGSHPSSDCTHTHTHTHTHTDTQTHRHTDTQTHRHTHTHTLVRTLPLRQHMQCRPIVQQPIHTSSTTLPSPTGNRKTNRWQRQATPAIAPSSACVVTGNSACISRVRVCMSPC